MWGSIVKLGSWFYQTCCFKTDSSRCWSSVRLRILVSSSSNKAFCKFIRSWTFSLVSWLNKFNKDSSSSTAFSLGFVLNCESLSANSFFNKPTSTCTIRKYLWDCNTKGAWYRHNRDDKLSKSLPEDCQSSSGNLIHVYQLCQYFSEKN